MVSETAATFDAGSARVIDDNVQPRPLQLRADSRGWLLKILMREHIEGSRSFGEIYVTAAHPGQVKGNHYHRNATEWFSVVHGRGRLVTRDLKTGEQREFLLSPQHPLTVRVGPGVAHAVENVGDDLMLLLAYADEPYDHSAPDEVRTIVIEPPPDR